MTDFQLVISLILMWIGGFLISFGLTSNNYKDHLEALGYETTLQNGFWTLTQ